MKRDGIRNKNFRKGIGIQCLFLELEEIIKSKM